MRDYATYESRLLGKETIAFIAKQHGYFFSSMHILPLKENGGILYDSGF